MNMIKLKVLIAATACLLGGALVAGNGISLNNLESDVPSSVEEEFLKSSPEEYYKIKSLLVDYRYNELSKHERGEISKAFFRAFICAWAGGFLSGNVTPAKVVEAWKNGEWFYFAQVVPSTLLIGEAAWAAFKNGLFVIQVERARVQEQKNLLDEKRTREAEQRLNKMEFPVISEAAA
ncbi:MAG: hypothetical protein JW725_01275 [Candidatus Babeliaceae bacterium]|nr:hypothetical protein [Candidatus Babeliaceae bacterium]